MRVSSQTWDLIHPSIYPSIHSFSTHLYSNKHICQEPSQTGDTGINKAQAASSLVTKYELSVAKAGYFLPPAPSIVVTSSGQPSMTAAWGMALHHCALLSVLLCPGMVAIWHLPRGLFIVGLMLVCWSFPQENKLQESNFFAWSHWYILQSSELWLPGMEHMLSTLLAEGIDEVNLQLNI